MSGTGKVPLSVVLITLNAERTLMQCLESVAVWADDLVVVDSGSTDATVRMARQFGGRIFHRAFDGFGPQKQYAVDQARHDWVLLLDADEIILPPLAREIQALFASGEPLSAGYLLPRNLIFLGRLLRHGGQRRQPVLRLFDRRQGGLTPDLVHESIHVRGTIGRLVTPMIHDSYGSLHEYVVKMNQYTTFSAGQMAARHKKAHVSLQGLRFLFTFVKIYLLKGGWLDGYPGFMWAFLSAMSPVIKYTKLQEMQDAEKHRTEPTLAFQ